MTVAPFARLSTSRLSLVGSRIGVAATASLPTTRNFSASSERWATWGFIGLGRMGYPMALNLRAKLPKEDNVVLFDRNTEAASKFIQEAASDGSNKGVEVLSSVREVAERSETIITVLPEPSHVKSVFHQILLTQLAPLSSGERLFIDCSTIDPTSSREVANAVHSTSSGRFVDAPMSGGVVGATAGTLTFMLGASSRSGALVDRVRPILLNMGARVFHLGEQGAGLSGKLANNYLLAISNIATAEAMNLGLRLGLDPQKLGELINSSSGRCWSSEINNPVKGVTPGAPAEQDYEGGFGVGLMKKDLRLALETAGQAGANIELGKEATRIYDEVEAQEGAKDFSVVYKWLSSKS